MLTFARNVFILIRTNGVRVSSDAMEETVQYGGSDSAITVEDGSPSFKGFGLFLNNVGPFSFNLVLRASFPPPSSAADEIEGI